MKKENEIFASILGALLSTPKQLQKAYLAIAWQLRHQCDDMYLKNHQVRWSLQHAYHYTI